MGDLIELLAADVLQLFAFGGELLIDFDRLFGHGFVSVAGTAEQGEIGAGGQAFMAVGIQAQAEHHGCFLLFVLFRHASNLTASAPISKWKKSSARRAFPFRGFRTEFQNVAGLAVERLANRFQRGETDGLGLAGFEDGQVWRRDVHRRRQFVQPHFPLRQNHVKIDDDGHKLKRSIPVPLEFSGLRP